jgi:hypothetical protein
MNFKKSLPPDLYQQLTTAHPYHFAKWPAPTRKQVAIDDTWSLCINPSTGPLTALAAKDLLAFFKTTFNLTVRRSRKTTDPCIHLACSSAAQPHPERYQLTITKDRIDILADDDEAAMRALFHLQREMLNHRAPILPLGSSDRSPKWELRIGYPVIHKPMDDPADYLDYPDTYLLNMSRFGYNATFFYLDLLSYIPRDIEPLLAHPDHDLMLDNLRRAARRLQSFGLRPLLHTNTLALPADHPLFAKYPTMRGAETGYAGHHGSHCLCSSDPRVHSLFQRTLAYLFQAVPELAGTVLIVGGECFLHCYSRPLSRHLNGTSCPRCSQQTPDRIISNLVNLVTDSVTTLRPGAHVLVWQYSAFNWGDTGTQMKLVSQLDPRASVLETFVKDSWLTIDGTRSYIFDYSISQLGPAPRFTRFRQATRQHNLKLFAKTESSQCIEMFTVPRLPIMHRWAKRAELLRQANLAGVHVAWRFYGFCAQATDEIIDHFAWQDQPDGDALLQQIATRDFGPHAASSVLRAWRYFSDAFAHFPYCCGTIGFPYLKGPFYIGPAHPLVFDLTAPLDLSADFFVIDLTLAEVLRDTTQLAARRQPTFFIDTTWTQPFGPVKIRPALLKLERIWRKGLPLLHSALATSQGRERERLHFELDLATIIHCSCVTAINLLDLQQTRNHIVSNACTPAKLKRACLQALEILKRERDNAQRALPVAQRRGSFGFGATYGRAFSADLIQQKLEHTNKQIAGGIANFYTLYANHAFAQPAPLQPPPAPAP